MESTDLVTSLTSLVALLASGGVAAVTASLRRATAPLRGRRDLRVCVVCSQAEATSATAFRQQLLAAGYAHVALTHSPAAAQGDAVVLWRPAVDDAAAIVAALRLAAPLGYLLLFTQDRVPVVIDDRSLLANSRLRLLSDLAVVAEAHGAEAR